MKLMIGVLAPQGGFEAHQKMIDDAYEEPIAVHAATGLASVDGLIISGTNAAAQLKLLQAANLIDELRQFGQEKPIIGVGAAACLLAREVKSPALESLDLMNIGVECDAYEHQVDSRTEVLRHEFDDDSGPLQAVFLRPPIIRWVGPETAVLAKCDGVPVLVEQGMHLVSTFQLELSKDRRVYAYFIDKVRDSYWNLRIRRESGRKQ